MLLPAPTITATCATCHDGTGGGGVYGVIERRTGVPAGGGHRVDRGAVDGKTTVPGGDPSGVASSVSFWGAEGSLACNDCHSPHDAQTVEPFVGDRARSAEDTTSGIATNRLLRQKPSSADATVTAYGSDWCMSCHKGSSRGSMTHPVGTLKSDPPVKYNAAYGLASYDSSQVAATARPVGGTNLGYVVPTGSGRAPLCQQCHEDARAIANDLDKPLSVVETFSPGVDGGVGNPRFQNFPHETVNANLLLEPEDSLCLNCHSTSPGSSQLH